jgi:hypothetical protein
MRDRGDLHLAYWLRTLEVPSFVYVIRGDTGGPVKIGTTLDVYKRMAQLQTGNPRHLALVQVLPGNGELEHALHARFAESRIGQSEWFEGGGLDALLNFVADLAQAMVDAHDGGKRPPRLDDWTPTMTPLLGPDLRQMGADAVAARERDDREAERNRRPEDLAGLDAFMEFHGESPRRRRTPVVALGRRG